jgi:hypothetical protein
MGRQEDDEELLLDSQPVCGDQRRNRNRVGEESDEFEERQELQLGLWVGQDSNRGSMSL